MTATLVRIVPKSQVANESPSTIYDDILVTSLRQIFALHVVLVGMGVLTYTTLTVWGLSLLRESIDAEAQILGDGYE